jgi:molybdopterin synthase sulfur carrier subunit
MKVTVRFFASLREALGAQTTLALDEGATVGTARDALIGLSASHADLLARGRAVRAAVNHELSEEALALKDGDELAFFPPVTGG